MKIKLQPAPLANIVVITKDGKQIKNDDVREIIVEPFLSTPSASGEVLRGQTVNKEDRMFDNFVLAASGQTGKVTKRFLDAKGAVASIDKPGPASARALRI